METQTGELTSPAVRRTFRQRVDGLMDIVIMRMDEDTTSRHELANIRVGNLLGAATKLVEALEANADNDLITGTSASFAVESGQWDQTSTLKELATEHGVLCQISDDGTNTTVDLNGAARASVLQLTNAVINQAVKDLKDNATFE